MVIPAEEHNNIIYGYQKDNKILCNFKRAMDN